MITKEKKALLRLMNEHCDCPDFSFASCKECEKAVKEIEKDIDFVDKHRWHDLRKNPNDLPEGNKKDLIDVVYCDGTSNVDTICNVRDGILFSGKIYVAWKYREPFEEEVYTMRDATKEECESVNNYIDSISKPTGITFDEEVENFCHEEIKTAPRITLINTEEELKQVWDDYIDKSVDLNKEGSAFDFYMFLQEKIEVE